MMASLAASRLLGSETERGAGPIRPDVEFLTEPGGPSELGELEPLLPHELLRAAAREELRLLYDAIEGEILTLDDDEPGPGGTRSPGSW